MYGRKECGVLVMCILVWFSCHDVILTAGGRFLGTRLRVNYTSYASSLQVGGRGRPGWPRQTRF